MRYLTPVFAACSGLVVATAGFNAFIQTATAAQVTSDHRMAAVTTELQVTPAPKVREVCSRNRPLSVSADGTRLASAQTPQGVGQDSGWAANIVQLFCRDVRINTIVVRDYCAVIRE